MSDEELAQLADDLITVVEEAINNPLSHPGDDRHAWLMSLINVLNIIGLEYRLVEK